MTGRAKPDDVYRADWIAYIHSRCVRTESGCLVWQGGHNDRGYAQTSYRNRTIRIHRQMFELFNGPIPAGLLVCHRCDNRLCCEVTHLWLGTPKQNSLDMSAKRRQRWQRKTHCQRGHEFAGDNLKLFYREGRPIRKCKACQNWNNSRMYSTLGKGEGHGG